MWAVACAMAALVQSAADAQLPRVVIETDAGVVVVEVDTVRAPLTGRNFLRYVDHGFYTNGRFYRAVRLDNQPGRDVRIEVIQGGVNRDRARERYPAIPLERTTVTGLSHRDGTVSMARAGPDTASTEFFICIGDQPDLDAAGRRHPDGQGFAAFGMVIRGMDVVRSIHQRPVDAQRLTPPVPITSMTRMR